jgi:hypothetical protein
MFHWKRAPQNVISNCRKQVSLLEVFCSQFLIAELHVSQVRPLSLFLLTLSHPPFPFYLFLTDKLRASLGNHSVSKQIYSSERYKQMTNLEKTL